MPASDNWLCHSYLAGRSRVPAMDCGALILDRDGVINRLVRERTSDRHESPLHPSEVRLVEGVGRWMQAVRQRGWLVACVTNQPAAAKGTVTVHELIRVHRRVRQLLANAGVYLDADRMCLHHPKGCVPGLTRRCNCRKPAPGMVLSVAAELGIALERSWMIGDTDDDVAAGRAAGARTILITNLASAHKRRGSAREDLTAGSLVEALAIILGSRSEGKGSA